MTPPYLTSPCRHFVYLWIQLQEQQLSTFNQFSQQDACTFSRPNVINVWNGGFKSFIHRFQKTFLYIWRLVSVSLRVQSSERTRRQNGANLGAKIKKKKSRVFNPLFSLKFSSFYQAFLSFSGKNKTDRLISRVSREKRSNFVAFRSQNTKHSSL